MRIQLVVGVVAAAVVGCGGGGGGGGSPPPGACAWDDGRHCTVLPPAYQAELQSACDEAEGQLVASCPAAGVQATCTVTGSEPYTNRYYDDYVGSPIRFLEDRSRCGEDHGAWVEAVKGPIALSCARNTGGDNYCMDVYGPEAADGCQGLTELTSPCPVDEATIGMCYVDDGADGALRIYAYGADTFVEGECHAEGGVWTPVL